MEKLIYALLLTLASVTAFSGLRQADFVWDDTRALALVDASDKAPVTPPGKLLQDQWRIQRDQAFQPMTSTLWTLVQIASPEMRMTPRTLHGLSLGLHIANSVLVLLVLSLVLQSNGAALVGALLFALHPLQVEPVAYIAATPFVLGTFFALFALWQYLLYCEHSATDSRRSGHRYIQLGTLAFILALLTTAATAVLPLIAFILLGTVPKRSSLNSSRMPLWPLILWGILALAPVFWAIKADSTQALAAQIPFWTRPFIAGDALMFYISKFLVPMMMGPDYGRSPSYIFSHWWGYLTWLLPLMLLAFIAYSRGQLQKIYFAAFGVFVIGLLPYLGLVLFSAQGVSTVSNSFAYLALLGPALAVAGTVALGRRSWLPALCGGVIAVFAYLSFLNVGHWQNDKVLWEHAVQVNPNSPIVHATLGNSFRREGNWEQARAHYEKVLAVNQIDPDITFYLGEIERQHGAPAKAAELFTRTLELNPNFTEAYSRLGLTYYELGDFEKAAIHFKKAAELMPENPSNQLYLGMLSVRRGQYPEAVPHLQQAMRFADPNRPAEQARIHALLGLALARTDQTEQAQTHLEAAVKLEANDHNSHRTLGDIYYAQGLFVKARPHYEMAIKSSPRDAELCRNLGIVLAQAKDYERAIEYFNRALEIKPDWPEVLTTVGNAYFHIKRLKEASLALKRSLALQPNQADPHQILGDIARWQGKDTEAMGEYYSTLKINPEHSEANYRIGNWFMKKERRAEAIHHYKIAARTAPVDSVFQSQLRKAERRVEGKAQGSPMEGQGG